MTDANGSEQTVTEEAVAWLMKLVDIDATSGNERAISDGFATFGDALGLPVRRWPVAPGRDNILMGATRPRLVFCTHIDTVPPHIPARRTESAIYGRGSADAAGVAVAMAMAARALADRGRGNDVACWFVVGEETDHSGAKALLSYPDPPQTIILGEPCGGLPVRGQKGLLKIRLTASGIAAHSAYPELGASAVHALVHALDVLLRASLPQDLQALGETTVNVGLIQGGVAPNVVAPEASANVLIRCAAPVDEILAHVRRVLDASSLAGTTLSLLELNRAEPIEFLASPATLGTVASGPPVPFNTDAHTMAPLGATMVLMGPGDMRCCHGPDEHLPIDALQAAITDYVSVAGKLLG